MNIQFKNYTAVFVAGGFALLAGLHRLMMGTPIYTERWIGLILVLFMVMIGFLIILLGLATLYALITRQWRVARTAFMNLIGVMIMLVLGIWFDAPTLIYAT